MENKNSIVLFEGNNDNQTNNCLFDKIDKYIYIGNVDTAKNKELLMQNGIKRIVNVTDNIPNFFENEFEYFNLKVEDRRTKFKIILENLENALNFIETSKKKTLIHCNAGTSRSATILLIYIMKVKNITLKKAFEYVLNKRSTNSYTHPNIGFFQKILLPFEKSLFNENSLTLSDYQGMQCSGLRF